MTSINDYKDNTINGMYETLNKFVDDVHKLYQINKELRDEVESLNQLVEFYKCKAAEARNQLIVQEQMAKNPSY